MRWASTRLLDGAAPNAAMYDDEVLRQLSRIARVGKPADRLRALEAIAKLTQRDVHGGR